MNCKRFYISMLYKEFWIMKLCQGFFYLVMFLILKYDRSNPINSLVKTSDYSVFLLWCYDVSKNLYGHVYLWICDELINDDKKQNYK